MKNTLFLLVIGSAFLTGCATEQTLSPNLATVSKADAVAQVNGRSISKADFAELEKQVAAQSQGQKLSKANLMDELIKRELLLQDVQKKKLDESSEVVAQLAAAKKNILTQVGLQAFVKTNPVTDAEIKAEYDSKKNATTDVEYKARHILVKTADEAKKVIAQLNKKADFSKLANQVSLDAKESQNGGDLGWFSAGQMVAPFSEAVMKLKKGEYSQAPVQTQFGYHVILREDSRPAAIPPLEAVKEQLKPYLERQKVLQMLDNLRKEAAVEILIPLEEQPPKAVDASIPTSPAATKEAVQVAAPTESEKK